MGLSADKLFAEETLRGCEPIPISENVADLHFAQRRVIFPACKNPFLVEGNGRVNRQNSQELTPPPSRRFGR